tara:strand:+ start:2278 stop:2499 length:222 start_codon:yes stop_codon:yes gene_type:complete
MLCNKSRSTKRRIRRKKAKEAKVKAQIAAELAEAIALAAVEVSANDATIAAMLQADEVDKQATGYDMDFPRLG